MLGLDHNIAPVGIEVPLDIPTFSMAMLGSFAEPHATSE
jgi:hypothetical protein